MIPDNSPERSSPDKSSDRSSPDRSSKEWWSDFQELLDDQNEWPTEYVFKFIVPSSGLDDVKQALGAEEVTTRESSRGRYVSVTARMHMNSSEAVVDVYKSVRGIDGVISL